MPPEKKQSSGAPAWMATFADLATLLLTFFVLLLTFANMDVQKFREMLGSVQGAFGVQFKQRGDYQPTIPEKKDPVRDLTKSMPKVSAGKAALEAQRMARQIRNLVQSQGMGDLVEISSGKNGVRLRVKGKLFFVAGDSRVKKSAKKLLDGIVRVMNKFDFYLTVEGHTDNIPIATKRYPSNWELSASRASAVLRYLVRSGVAERRVSAIGYASNYPVATNSSGDGRNRNRRVEFVFTRKPLRQLVEQ